MLRTADAATNAWINSSIKAEEERRGIKFPMANVGFNFFNYCLGLANRGKSGQDAEDLAFDIVRRVTIGESGNTNIFSEYDPARGIQFDRYFMMKAKDASNSIGVTGKNAKRGEIDGGYTTDEGGMGNLAEDSSVVDDPSRKFEAQASIFDLHDYIGAQQFGPLLQTIAQLIYPQPQGLGMSHSEAVDWLKEHKVETPTGNTGWTTGVLSNYIKKIRNAVRDYARRETRHERDNPFSSVTRGVYGEDERLADPGGGKASAADSVAAPTKPVRAMSAPKKIYHMVDGDQSNLKEIEKVVRKARNNARVRYPDGTEAVIPSTHIQEVINDE